MLVKLNMYNSYANNSFGYQTCQLCYQYSQLCICFPPKAYADSSNNFYNTGYYYSNNFNQPQYSYPNPNQQVFQNQCQIFTHEWYKTTSNNQSFNSNFGTQIPRQKKIQKNISTQCNFLKKVNNIQCQVTKNPTQKHELSYFENEENSFVGSFQNILPKNCIEIQQKEEKIESLEKIKNRNQFNDIMHILKVRRFWNNSNFQSPNVFKKRKLKTNNSSKESFEQEIHDLSRTKSLAIKDEGDGYASLVDKAKTN